MEDTDEVNQDHAHPLLAPLVDSLRVDDLESRTRRSPLDGLDLAVLSNERRHQLLDEMQERLFQPNTVTLDLGTRLFRMIRRGYLTRDPRELSVRKDVLALTAQSGRKLNELPWFHSYAKCMRISGETGTGKTYEVVNLLRLIPPVIVHSENKEAGWAHLVQVPKLYVSMSHDGTLGGLLLSILVALDEAIGTKYSTQSSLTRLSNEKLAVRVGIILRVHAVGVLVIDEIQERNFAGGHGSLAALFFLRLLNFGIPLVLMGNPFGLSALDRFSQDVRRTGSAGSIDFEPHNVNDSDWVDCIAPGVWSYYVLPNPAEFTDKDGALLFRFSGGFRDYGFRVSNAAQRLALDLGDDALTEAHLEMAFQGNDFSERDRDLIRGFVLRDPIRLQKFEDVRVLRYAKKWGVFATAAPSEPVGNSSELTTQETADESQGSPEAATAKSARTQHQIEVTAAKRLATQRANEAKRRESAKAKCGEDDIRNDGLKSLLITGFDALRGAV